MGSLSNRIVNICSDLSAEDKEKSAAEIGLDLIQQLSVSAGAFTGIPLLIFLYAIEY